MQLKEDHTLSTRDNPSVTKFFQTIKIIIDHLVSEDDLTQYILNGLGLEFREIVTPIHACKISLKFKEIHDVLVGHESYRLETQSVSNMLATANYSQ